MLDGGNFRVLVVDDDEIAIAAMSSVLAEAGCIVVKLATPIGVTQVAINQNIDVVILDLQMPALPGDRLAAMLRGNRRLQNIPVILVSAAPEHELRRITSKLPGVVALPKRRVRRDLGQLVRELAVRRRSADNAALPTGDQLMAPGASMAPPPGSAALCVSLPPPRVEETLRSSLPRRLVGVTKLWREASCGSVRAFQDLMRELHEIKGECQLLELEPLAELVSGIELSIRAFRTGEIVPTCSAGAVLAGFNLLARMARSPEDTREKELQAVLTRLAVERKRVIDQTPLVGGEKVTDAAGAA